MQPRIQFIEEVRQYIARNVPKEAGTRAQVLEAIARWERGEAKRDPFEGGVFAMCDQVRKDMEEAG